MHQYFIFGLPPTLGRKSTLFGEVFAYMESEYLIAAAMKTMVNYIVSIPPSYQPTLFQNFGDLDHIHYEEELYNCVSLLLAEMPVQRCEQEWDRTEYSAIVRTTTYPYYLQICNHIFYTMIAMRGLATPMNPQGHLDAYIAWLTDTEFMLVLADGRFDCQQPLTSTSMRNVYFHPIGVW